MIYLIDDKKNRQATDFSWNTERFEIFKDIIFPIYTLDHLVELSDEVFRPNNTVIYHESFLNGTELKDEAIEKRMKLENYASSNYDFKLAIFSGSISSRTINENIAYLPVATMYQNLEHLVEKDIPLLEVLLFGEFPEIEKELSDSLDESNKIVLNEKQIEIENSNVLFIHPQKRKIQSPIKDAKEVTIFNKVSDSDLSNKVKDWLNEHKYNLIYVPISFGPVLSDFNGLRLATHIRCTKSLNQTTKIIIYSFTSVSNLFNSPYFNILKTKNTTLITHRKSSMLSEGIKEIDELQIQDLPKELSKLKLDVPLNYEDSHSIANIWTVYSWSKYLGINVEDELNDVSKAVNDNLYFKYLKESSFFKKSNKNYLLQKKETNESSSKVLLIDDDYNKGWDLFYKKLIDSNPKYTLKSLKLNYSQLSQRQLIDYSKDCIVNFNPDLVLLDLRLIVEDFEKSTENKNQYSGIKILKEIKKINRGIQVIITTASNQTSVYESILKNGANSFVLKSYEIDASFSVENLKSKIAESSEKAKELKNIYSLFEKIEFVTNCCEDDFKGKIKGALSVAWELIEKSFDKDKYRNFAYLQLFLLIEEFIKLESVYESGFNHYVVTPKKRYLVLAKDPLNDKKPPVSAIKFNKGKYLVGKSNYSNRRVDTNFIVSSIMLFRLGLNSSSEKNWTKVYKIRNEKAAHPEKGIVTFQDLARLNHFLEFFLDINNIVETNSKLSLPELSDEEKLEQLKKKFGG
ncbi:MAG: hypothetical protein CMP67_10275 [Flavobacteriales bacterium]|nr:hypothetical protein [Flavobacteriales bacterium]|tara:strand:+ start:2130 stop:4361 length:2232 start_codon:yes stop_codon:yes gene_type:complete